MKKIPFEYTPNADRRLVLQGIVGMALSIESPISFQR